MHGLKTGDRLTISPPANNFALGAGAGVDPLTAPWLGVVAESGCRYFAELQFPDPLDSSPTFHGVSVSPGADKVAWSQC